MTELDKTPRTGRNTVGYPQGEFVPVRIAKELEIELSSTNAQLTERNKDAVRWDYARRNWHRMIDLAKDAYGGRLIDWAKLIDEKVDEALRKEG